MVASCGHGWPPVSRANELALPQGKGVQELIGDTPQILKLNVRTGNVVSNDVHGFDRVGFRHDVDGARAFPPVSHPDQPAEPHDQAPRRRLASSII
jgi:hypothetical protein